MMKPEPVVTVIALVAAAAGVGAYLAVRQNVAQSPVAIDALSSAADTAPAMPVAEAGDDSAAVDATEALVAPAPPPEPDPEPPAAQPVARPAPPAPRRTVAARTPDPEPVEPVSPAPADPTPSTPPPPAPRATRELPQVDGWERLDGPWPASRDERVDGTEADRVALATLDAAPLHTVDPEPPAPILEELVISADSVIGLQIDSFVTTDVAAVEDDVEARVTRDVMVADRVAIPAGTVVMGSVVLAEQGGKIKGASRLGVRFHTVVFDHGIEVPIVTETVYREGQSRGGESAAKIGGAAVGGAILGAIFGGSRGAAIGGAAGAAGGTAAAVAGDAEPATLPEGTALTVRLSRPATVTVER